MIFIAGCARSGTTLMQRLMRCFDIRVIPGEQPTSMLVNQSSPVVVKRNSHGWRELPHLHPSIGILYMVRHPHDVLTSYHPRTRSRGYHVTPERWINEYNAWQGIAGRPNTLMVRYEDLLRGPGEMQELLAHKFGLTPMRDFAAAEHLDTTRIGRHARDPEACAYLDGLPEHVKALITQFCKEFGYA